MLEKDVIRDLVLLGLSIGCLFLLFNPRLSEYKWIGVIGFVAIVIYRIRKGEWNDWWG